MPYRKSSLITAWSLEPPNIPITPFLSPSSWLETRLLDPMPRVSKYLLYEGFTVSNKPIRSSFGPVFDGSFDKSRWGIRFTNTEALKPCWSWESDEMGRVQVPERYELSDVWALSCKQSKIGFIKTSISGSEVNMAVTYQHTSCPKYPLRTLEHVDCTICAYNEKYPLEWLKRLPN